MGTDRRYRPSHRAGHRRLPRHRLRGGTPTRPPRQPGHRARPDTGAGPRGRRRLLHDDADPGLLHAAGADFRQLSEVASLARHLHRRHDRLDLLINNAGAIEPASRTRDGLDVNFQINYVAPYALTRLLAVPLKAAGARVVTVAASLHRDAHLDLDNLGSEQGRPADAYARAQLALLLFNRALAETAERRITAVAVHPGCIDTGTLTAVYGRGGLPVTDGAAHVMHAADPGVPVDTGSYYEGLLRADPGPAAHDGAAATRLWTATARLLGWDYTAFRAPVSPPLLPKSVSGAHHCE